MKHSEIITHIAGALVAVQKELKPVLKDGTNPHFKNRYATLDALTEYVRPILASHGIVLLQGGTESGGVETMLIHNSGEWISSSYQIPLEKGTAQSAGSAITYGRRYGLASILALTTDEDDDAEGAVKLSRLQDGYSRDQTIGPTRVTSTGPEYAATSCPVCHSDMWDNRLTKKNPKQPDFKCKDPKCSGAIWPPKGGPVNGTAENTRLVRDSLQTKVAGDDDELPF